MTDSLSSATPTFLKRAVTSFRIREDFVAKIDAECKRLNCSKGVYFEILLAKAWQNGEMTSEDVFQYDAGSRWQFERMAK